jgi:hemoglobin
MTSSTVRGDLATRGDIERMVRDFYREAAMDDLLGPIFAAAQVDWPAHIARLTDFWSWQLLGEPGYDGNPLRSHAPVHARTPFTCEHYERWIDLFCGTIEAAFEGPIATTAIGRGRRMASALQRLLEGVEDDGDAPIEPRIMTMRR